jgi:pimeloyl-ACP methyl ester carboxylesterase
MPAAATRNSVFPMREAVRSSDGVAIGTMTVGTGPPLLLVHGGMRTAANWNALWPLLTARYRVTAMDRRGRGMSGDAPDYAGEREYDDVAAVARRIGQIEGPVDVLAHSVGAVFALGAAAGGAPIRRMLLCEPPGPPTQSREALERRAAWIAEGQAGRALVQLLVEVMGMDPAMLAAMRDTPAAADSLAVFTATYQREGEFLQTVDLAALARDVTVPVHLLLGETSPAWAGEVTRALAVVLPAAEVTVVPGHGHDMVDSAPEAVVATLAAFLA